MALPLASLRSEVIEIVVGVTPACPEGLMGCWGEARVALRQRKDVERVSLDPDRYNSTASVRTKSKGLPDPAKWSEQFRALLGGRIAFRGVEVTVRGTLQQRDGSLYLRLPESAQPLRLQPLENKLQWNFKMKRARGLEDAERTAHADLLRATAGRAGKEATAEITGPLRTGLILEVRKRCWRKRRRREV